MRGLHISTLLAYTYFTLLALTEELNFKGADITGVYYNATSKIPLPLVDGGQTPPTGTGVKLWPKRIYYRSNGCTCQELECGCCLGINLQQFNFQREGCLNFTYDPQGFSIIMEMYMNENLLFNNAISAKNPPPLCIPLSVPYLPLPTVDFCAKLFDVHTPGQNLHMCLDFETRIERAPIFVLHFDCMRMGMDGIAVVKPGQPGIPVTTSTSTSDPVTDTDTYDEVTEIKYKQDKFN